MRLICLSACALAVVAKFATASMEEDKVMRAESAAHTDLSSTATIMDTDGTVLRKGSSHWHCMPGIPVMEGDAHPMCNDPVWTALLQAAAEGKPFETDKVGFSYMLQGDALVSNESPAATDPNDGGVWVEEGPHIMIVVPRALLEGISTDPYNGGPYVMWKDTPYAHIMIPVGNKTKP
ncbi:hypothetical protein [Vibrio fluvialis]|uniref:hypothetical protein n=1 Tax=Vibrio fluvialis TaxID=676 RepID=UPI0028F6F6C1|nr:hypothetical protein [Vibrio fluvialis]